MYYIESPTSWSDSVLQHSIDNDNVHLSQFVIWLTNDQHLTEYMQYMNQRVCYIQMNNICVNRIVNTTNYRQWTCAALWQIIG